MPSRSPLAAVSARRSRPSARFSSAAGIQTPEERAYSVRAKFALGTMAYSDQYRVRVEATSLSFERQLQRAFDETVGRGWVSVQSASAVVSPERTESRFIGPDAGVWPVQMDARFVSRQRLTRDEWVLALGIAFRWAYSITYAYPGDGVTERGLIGDTYGPQGNGEAFVAAANRSVAAEHGVIYGGGSMLDLGPTRVAAPAQTSAPSQAGPWPSAAPTPPRPTTAPPGPARRAESDPARSAPPADGPGRSDRIKVAVALAAVAAVAAAVVAVLHGKATAATAAPSGLAPGR